jgi:putative nucleotidyltransferase with HDIG domain
MTGPDWRRRSLQAAQVVLLVLSVGVAVATTGADDWHPLGLFASLLVLAIFGEFLAIRTGGVHIGPAFLATALGMALLGPAPAAVIAVLAMLGPVVRERTPGHLVLNNVVALTTYPVVGALLIEAISDPRTESEVGVATAVTVFVVCLLVNALNFALIVGYLTLLERTSFLRAVRTLYLPVVPWEVATALLTALTVIAYDQVGILAIALLAVPLFIQRSLLQALVDVEAQRNELREQMDELLALHDGVVRVMVETLSMRDEMTARHSAAVARFALATAEAAGLPRREQELVHTAGLLHDVGKFAFPDHTLNSPKLSAEDWALIRTHPQRGADIVGRVRGYAEVADVILHHHERIDGTGYPNGVAGADIPVLARIISVVDTFDVMTARDSYRTPVSTAAAIAELRNVSGTQLDADLVEVFVSLLERKGIGFVHADNKDLEKELSSGRRSEADAAPGRWKASISAA